MVAEMTSLLFKLKSSGNKPDAFIRSSWGCRTCRAHWFFRLIYGYFFFSSNAYFHSEPWSYFKIFGIWILRNKFTSTVEIELDNQDHTCKETTTVLQTAMSTKKSWIFWDWRSGEGPKEICETAWCNSGFGMMLRSPGLVDGERVTTKVEQNGYFD